MTDRAALAARFRHAASVWKGTCLAKVDVSAEVCDLDVIADALSTPSASAGPQAEAVAWLVEWPEDDNVPVRWWNPNTGWMRDANKAMRFCRECDAADYINGSGHWTANVKPTEHKFLSRAHPQPQQADGRGAVIEECKRICRSAAKRCIREGIPGDSVANFIEQRIAALSQAPAADGPAK